MRGYIVSMMLKTKFCLLSVMAPSLILIRVESGSAGRVASKVLHNAFLCCFMMGFFSEFHFNAENTGTH